MCLVVFSCQQHPEYPLLIASNRDEFYSRPTEPAGFWKSDKQILAGRDLMGGGTWMGVSRTGRVALLTNYRDPQDIKENAPSRGALVRDFLVGEMTAEEYLQDLRQTAHLYNGFNLVCGGLKGTLLFYGNHTDRVQEIAPGLHGLSNATLDTSWPKVVRAKRGMAELLEKSMIRERELFELLYDDVKAPRKELPDTGVGMELEEMLSPVFIKSKDYGSRCSTVVMVDKDGHVTFSERTYDLVSYQAVTRSFLFSV